MEHASRSIGIRIPSLQRLYIITRRLNYYYLENLKWDKRKLLYEQEIIRVKAGTYFLIFNTNIISDIYCFQEVDHPN